MSYTDASFARAVKQNVRAKDWTFLAVCTPGFEAVLTGELKRLGMEAGEQFHGAVEWTCKMQDVPRILLSLRTANRVYVRMARFRAGAMEELFRKTSLINWEWWLPPQASLRVKSQVEYSRLSHEGECSLKVERAVQRRLEEAGASAGWYRMASDSPALVLARVQENQVNLSLDASGDLHYRRGYRLAQAKAPLRESLAASLLLWAFPDIDWQKAQVHDGMCGGGTFIIEALGLASGGLAGTMRSFAFEAWPALSAETLNHTRKKSLLEANIEAGQLLSGTDTDPEVLAKAQLCAEYAANAWNCSVPDWQVADFFSATARQKSPLANHHILCLNPPYGIRLDIDVDDFFRRMAETIGHSWRGWHILCIVPFKELLRHFPQGARIQEFRHGGLRVQAVAFMA